jgi:hypothetical protein
MTLDTCTDLRPTAVASDPGAAHPLGLFAREDVRGLGLSNDVLRWRVRTGAWIRLRRDTYITAERLAAVSAEPRSLHLLHAGAALQRSQADDLVLSHRSAAIAHGLPLLHRWPARPEITVPRHRRGTLAEITQHTVRVPLPASDITVVQGTPVTNVLRTVVDVVRTTTRFEAIVVLDAALRSGAITRDDLWQAAAAWPEGRRGQELKRLIELADERSPDPLTSVARLVLLQHRVELDDVGVMIGRTTQGEALRIPLLWNHAGVAVIPSTDAQLSRVVRAVGMTPIAVDLNTVIQRRTEFAAVIGGLTTQPRAA